MLLINAPEIMAIPVQDNGEPLQEVPNSSRLHTDRSDENARTIGYQPDFRVRAGVIARLISAAERLPNGVHLRIKEGYRPLHAQERIFGDRFRMLALENPNEASEWIHRKAAEFVAPPDCPLAKNDQSAGFL